MEPPTSKILSMSAGFNPASFIAAVRGPLVFSTRSAVISSNFARVKDRSKCFGPSWSAVIKGRLMEAVNTFDNSTLAFSAASRRRCMAKRSPDRSTPCSCFIVWTIQSTILLSKSSPPRRVLPEVDFTSNTPSPISRIDTSKVPPPKSKMTIF